MSIFRVWDLTWMEEPKYFDGIYTGTETRDAGHTATSICRPTWDIMYSGITKISNPVATEADGWIPVAWEIMTGMQNNYG